MNVLHILSKFDSYDAIATTRDMATYLVRNGCNCMIASSFDSQILDLDKSNAKYCQLSSFETNIKDFFIAYKRLKEIIMANNVDIVHTHSILGNWLAFWVCRHTDRYLINSCYDFYSKNIFNYGLILANQVVVHNEAAGKHIINNFNLPIERVCFVKGGLDLEKFNFQGIDQRSKTDFNIGIIPSLFSDKGYEYFFKAMVKVVRNTPYLKICVISSPYFKKNIKEDLGFWARRLGLINYVNFLDNPDSDFKVLSRLNLLIFTPIKESASTRLIIEAQAYGVPVISTRVGGVAEAISEDKTGILVPPKDNNALGNAIIRILKNFQLCREITIAARKRIEEEFNLAQNSVGLIDVYKQVKNKRKILVINIGKTQDVVSGIPALRILRKESLNTQISVLMPSHLRCLLQRCPYIDELMVYDYTSKQKGLLGFRDILKLLIRKRPDIAFDLNNSIMTHLLAYSSLANKRYGYSDRFLKFLINHNMPRFHESLGLIEDKLAILGLLGINGKDDKLELWPSQEDMDFADNFLRDNWIGNEKIVGINISFKKLFFKDFKTLDYLAYLCNKLAGRHMRVILISSKDDPDIKDELLKRTSSKPIFLTRTISAIQLACLIKKCGIYITSDIESLYLAIAMKVSSIMLLATRNIFDSRLYKNVELLSIKDFRLTRRRRHKRMRLAQEEDTDLVIQTINRLTQTQ
ncbi:MAG: glycosyltransferase [Candidatus Omnitrophica bacterium]|nr:glycosyltransferase [Candidatus Omnitrophota bacterium]MDD5351833.1 glycosyltransferase [Candidatus Omnitrophota bacterium]MDD5550659.1 glycosyltransferase [Candidatus Omnitrophota bacterium]